MKLSLPLLLFIPALIASIAHAATDGFWSQTAGGSQDWEVTANWVGGTLADGADASAVFNVNILADQTIIHAGGKTVGHLFFQDTTTSSVGGYNIGAVADVGPLTLDVTSGRSIIDIGNLDT